MREILFRGKRIDDGVWVYGYFAQKHIQFQNDIYPCIFTPNSNGGFVEHLLKYDTECQYTGLKDKNGRKIFEGDIVKSKHNANFYKVYWQDNRFYIDDIWGNALKPTQTAISHFECEVIGNIYDNPELLEKE